MATPKYVCVSCNDGFYSFNEYAAYCKFCFEDLCVKAAGDSDDEEMDEDDLEKLNQFMDYLAALQDDTLDIKDPGFD